MVRFQGVLFYLFLGLAVGLGGIQFANAKVIIPKNKRILIVGFSGNLVVGASKTAELTWEGSATPSITQKEDAFILKLAQYSSPGTLKVWLPQRHTKISWLNGQVLIKNLDLSRLETYQQSGVLDVENTKGKLVAINLDGEVKIQGSEGILDISSYQGDLRLSGIEKGKIKLNNFLGNTYLTNIKSDVNLKSYKGKNHIVNVQGKLRFDNIHASLDIKNFDGTLSGKTGTGHISGTLTGGSSASVRSKSGTVNLDLMDSAAYVNVGTQKGKVYLPEHFKKTRSYIWNLTKGNFQGGSKVGKIWIRTQSGSVQVRNIAGQKPEVKIEKNSGE